ncbi:histidine phosphatase family protein [Kitasatospora sp. NPDC092286]|uniref:histidine phosphatase family protein n=1 Tax=Kitasatospora sp. NPDC092286 TaxID=3364087 RepID=UPI003805525B
MTARFVMIRHGRTTANADGILMGRNDAPLLPEALTGADRLGDDLALDITAVIYSSPQPRALDTARRISNGRCPLIPHDDLRERDFGNYNGARFSDLAGDPDWPRYDVMYDARPEDGESLRDVEQRLFPCLLALHEALPAGQTLVVVGHSTCWRLVESALRDRRHDPLDEPIPLPLAVLDHPRGTLARLRNYC